MEEISAIAPGFDMTTIYIILASILPWALIIYSAYKRLSAKGAPTSREVSMNENPSIASVTAPPPPAIDVELLKKNRQLYEWNLAFLQSSQIVGRDADGFIQVKLLLQKQIEDIDSKLNR